MQSGFELVSPCPFSTTITITPRAPPFYTYIWDIFKQAWVFFGTELNGFTYFYLIRIILFTINYLFAHSLIFYKYSYVSLTIQLNRSFGVISRTQRLLHFYKNFKPASVDQKLSRLPKKTYSSAIWRHINQHVKMKIFLLVLYI